MAYKPKLLCLIMYLFGLENFVFGQVCLEMECLVPFRVAQLSNFVVVFKIFCFTVRYVP